MVFLILLIPTLSIEQAYITKYSGDIFPVMISDFHVLD